MRTSTAHLHESNHLRFDRQWWELEGAVLIFWSCDISDQILGILDTDFARQEFRQQCVAQGGERAGLSSVGTDFRERLVNLLEYLLQHRLRWTNCELSIAFLNSDSLERRGRCCCEVSPGRLHV